MPPRRQSLRQQDQATSSGSGIDSDLIAKRTRRHLEDLERSNYVEDAGAFEEEQDGGAGSSRTAKARGAARQTISDKKDWGDGKKKKATSMKIRDALLYRQNLATLIERSGIADMPGPTYLTAVAPAPKQPPRVFCSVCGYWGKYKCMKCAMPYCSLDCQATHNDTRCEKRVI